eukprot:GSChrysophyteH1.ASY1.ANO1.3346.1 assembled CDS
MSDYAQISTDLLNAVKAESNAHKKHILLHQLREIALNRDTKTIPAILKDVIGLANREKISTVLFLVRFAGDCLRTDFSQLLTVLASFSFFMTVENDDVHTEVAIELSRNYSKITMAIAEMLGSADANEMSIKHAWTQFRSVATKVVDKISSNRASEQLRTKGIGLAESLILFGLPAPQQKADPRRRRGSATATSESGSSVANLTSMHPFILDMKAELEKEGEEFFSKLLLWAYQGGPQGSPFTPAQMALLGQAIASIAGQRQVRADGGDREDPRSSKATKALQVMLIGKKSVYKDMTGADKKALVLAMHRFMGTSPPDPSSDLPKLRDAVSELESLGFADPVIPERKTKKRARSASNEMEHELTTEEEIKKLALEALNESESAMKKAKSEQAALSLVSTVAPGAAVLETELSPDLAPEVGDHSAPLSKIGQQKASSHGTGISYSLVPLAVTTESIAFLASASLQRLLDSFYELKSEGSKAIASYTRMAVRTTLSQTDMQLIAATASDRSPDLSSFGAKIAIFSFVPQEVDQALLVGVPTEVTLPHPIWQLLSFVLRSTKEDENAHLKARQASLLGAVREKLNLLVLLMKELYVQTDNVTAQTFYDNVAIVTLSRLMQNWNLRELISTLFITMPRIPKACINLLKMLMITGTKPSSTATTNRTGKEIRQRGTRQESMTLLGGLVLAVDEEAARASLHHLLWCAVSDDFEVRSKAVALLTNEVMHSSDWAYEEVTMFALQAVAQIVGTKGVVARADVVAHARNLPWGTLATQANSEGADMEVNAPDAVAKDGDDANPDDSRMETDVDVDVEADADADAEADAKADVRVSVSLAAAVDATRYDDGNCFSGNFSSVLPLPSQGASTLAAAKTALEGHSKRCLQLLAQICAVDPSLLGAFVDVAAALAVEAGISTPAEVSQAAAEAVAAASVEKDKGREDAGIEEGTSTMTPRLRFDSVLIALRADLAGILPAVVVNHPTEKIFEALARSDPLGRPVLAYTMEVLHNDLYVPATPECIQAVTSYLRATSDNESSTISDPDSFLAELPEVDLRFCLPLLGGFSQKAIEGVLSKLLRVLIPTQDVLNRAISRLVLGRPSVMTKSQILTFLHRLNDDDKSEVGLDKTQIKDIIGVCLEREDFDADVIRETLFNLVEDKSVSIYLMRTGLLSAKKYKEVRKYLLQDTVPKLIRRKVWAEKDPVSGKYPVWEGVIQCVRLFGDAKDSEQMLRCVLSLDGPRLALVMKVAPKIQVILAKLLKTLSTKEREDVITGRWAGIAHSSGKVDTEKKKIFESLQTMKF